MPQELERTSNPLPPANSINLGPTTVLDLTGMTNDASSELKRQYAEGMIGVSVKAAEVNVDIKALSMKLGVFNDEAAKANQANVSMTVTHTDMTSIGKTEFVMGNTEQAAKGKLPSSDKTMWIIGIVAFCTVLIVALIFHH